MGCVMNSAPITPELRGQIVALRESGLSLRRIGEALRVSHTSVANALRDATEAGQGPVIVEVAPAPAPSSPALVTAARVIAPAAPALPAIPLDEIASLQAHLVQLNASAERAFLAKDFGQHSTIVRSISMVTKDIAKLRGAPEVDPEDDRETKAAGRRAVEKLRKLLAEALA